MYGIFDITFLFLMLFCFVCLKLYIYCVWNIRYHIFVVVVLFCLFKTVHILCIVYMISHLLLLLLFCFVCLKLYIYCVWNI